MFEKFGEFDSAEELNRKAMELLQDQDFDGVKALAKENGLDEEDAMDFMNGCMGELASVQTAAVGKLEMEAKEIKLEEIMEDWFDFINKQVMEDEEFAKAVRREGKSLVGCIGELLKWSYKNCYTVEKSICSAAGINQQVRMGIPGNMRARVIIREYYLEG